MKRLRSDDKDWKYDLARSFEYILNESKPRTNRAIRLYELQTAILIGKRLRDCQMRKEKHRDNWIRVSRAALSASRSISRLRLLEHMIRENHSDVGDKLSLKKLVRDRESNRLLQKICSNRSARQMAYSLSWRQFDRLLRDTRRKQESYAPLYHVSLHFALHGPPESRCSWSRVEALLKYTRNEPEYETIRKQFKALPSLSTAYKHKPKGHHFAAFIWLDHFGGKYLRPERPTSATFATKLLAKVDDLASLRSYLGQYAHVRAELVEQGYELPSLQLAAAIPPQNVRFKPLPSELTCLI